MDMDYEMQRQTFKEINKMTFLKMSWIYFSLKQIKCVHRDWAILANRPSIHQRTVTDNHNLNTIHIMD
jgi:hypothetical protein